MPTIQDTYNSAPAKGFPGMVANGETSNRISRTVENAEGIAFGAAAFRGSNDKGCVRAATANTFLGFVIADHGQPVVPGGVAADIVPRYHSAAIMTLGAIYVTVGEDVTDGAQVYVDPDDRAIVDTSTDNIIATGWFFDETVASGGICRIVRR